jgi:WD40 repeat protein/predicted Ser/Thr protein kinase
MSDLSRTTDRDAGSIRPERPRAESLDPKATDETTAPATDGHATIGDPTANDGGQHDLAGIGAHVRRFGDYELLSVLGKGGMGVVYKARQLSLNRLVAIKMLQSRVLPSDDELRRFQTEAEAVAMLDHPNIVPILEVGQHQEQRYYSMKLIDGSSLDQRLIEFRADPTSAARLVATVALAVQHAHERAVLHRDLKPANVMIDERGEPIVTDFGLARRLEVDSGLTQSGAIVGTPAYMAPEQASGKRREIGKATDIYGLGGILYALLTGHAPFQAESVAEVLEAVRERAPEAPSKTNRLVPRDLEVICLKCLEKDPARRYDRADSLAGDLNRWLAGKPIEARPVGTFERGWRWCRRNPATVGFSATIVLLLAAMVGVASYLGGWFGGRKLLDVRSSARSSDRARASAPTAKQRSRVAVRIPDQETVVSLRSGRDVTTLVGRGAHEISRLTGRYALKIAREGVTQDDVVNVVDGKMLEVDATPTGKAKAGQRQDLLNRFYQPQLKLRAGGHDAPVRAMVFSSDGSHLYSAGEDKVVNYWNLQNPSPMLERTIRPPVWRGVRGIVYAMALTPRPDAQGQSMLAVGGFGTESSGGDITIFRMPGMPQYAAGEVVQRLERPRGVDEPTAIVHRNTITCLAFDASGHVLASGSNDWTVILWDVARGFEPIRALKRHNGPIRDLAFNPAGNRLATVGADGLIVVWDVADGEALESLATRVSINTVAYSPDGRFVIAGSENGALVRLDAMKLSGDTALRLRAPDQKPILDVAYHPDGQLLAVSIKSAAGGPPDPMAVCCDIEVRAMPDGNIVHRWPGTQGLVRALAFSPRGDRLAYSGGTAQAVIVQDMSNLAKPPVEAKGDGSTLFDVGFTDDSQVVGFTRERVRDVDPPRLYDGFDMRLHRSRTVPREMLHRSATTYQGWALRPNFKPFGLEAVHPDGRLRRFEIDQMTERWWWSSTFVPPGPGHSSVTVAIGTEAGVAVFDFETGRRTRVFAGHTGPVVSLAASPDGRWLASSSFDQVIMLYPLAGCDARPALGATFHQLADRSWVVDRVEHPSFADAMGLHRGDVITEAGIGLQHFTEPDGIADFIARAHQEPPGISAIGIRARRTIWMPILKTAQVTVTLPTTKCDNQVLTLFQGLDNEWVLWTRQGYYDSSTIADQRYLGWHRNGDTHKPSSEFFPVIAFEAQFRRPDLLAALWAADDPARYEASLERLTPRKDPEPHRLMVLAVGPSESSAGSGALREIAGPDARNFADVLIQLGRRFSFDQVVARCLTGSELSSERIGGAFADLQAEGSTRPPRPGDTIVVFLESHLQESERGLIVFSSESVVEASPASTVNASDVGDHLKDLAQRGFQVLAFLDFRHSSGSDRLDQLMTEWERDLFLAGVAVFVGPQDTSEPQTDGSSQDAFAAGLLNALRKAVPSGSEPGSNPPLTVELFQRSFENEMRALTAGRQQPYGYFTEAVARAPMLGPKLFEQRSVPITKPKN